MSFTMHIYDGGPAPKRGDLLQSNVGDRRERTWFILRVRRIRRRQFSAVPRFEIWMARWWELEAEMRLRLYRSAERNGGQTVHFMCRYKPKKKQRVQFI